MKKSVLLLTDNQVLLERFMNLSIVIKMQENGKVHFDYAFSYNNLELTNIYNEETWIRPLSVKDNIGELIDVYDIIISLHCKQLFPKTLVNKVRCINVHPGLNPYNRGWFPQVFSIINGLPGGATIHEIDEELDHGPVICQKEVKIEKWDTSLTAYLKILDAEIELLEEHLENIIDQNYTVEVKHEGNLNLKKDFDKLCKIDLQDQDTFLNHINRLRALTHGNYTNAFFEDEKGNRIYLKLELRKE